VATATAEAYLLAEFRLDPCNRLATVHERHRQTDRQRTDSIGRTVLQTVAQKFSRYHSMAVTESGFIGRPFVKRFALCYQNVVCLSICLSCPVLSVCPVCYAGVLWPNVWMDQDETWYASALATLC